MEIYSIDWNCTLPVPLRSSYGPKGVDRDRRLHRLDVAGRLGSRGSICIYQSDIGVSDVKLGDCMRGFNILLAGSL